MTCTTESDMTIPAFAAAEGVALDRLRKLLRRRPDLQRLCRAVGPTRVIPAESVEEFRAAVREAMGA